MFEQIHGHQVMRLMLESGKTYTKESLSSEIQKRFGQEARFYTCSAQGMTAGEIIDFLEKRGKFHRHGQGFTTDAGKLCSHDGPHDQHDQ